MPFTPAVFPDTPLTPHRLAQFSCSAHTHRVCSLAKRHRPKPRKSCLPGSRTHGIGRCSANSQDTLITVRAPVNSSTHTRLCNIHAHYFDPIRSQAASPGQGSHIMLLELTAFPHTSADSMGNRVSYQPHVCSATCLQYCLASELEAHTLYTPGFLEAAASNSFRLWGLPLAAPG